MVMSYEHDTLSTLKLKTQTHTIKHNNNHIKYIKCVYVYIIIITLNKILK